MDPATALLSPLGEITTGKTGGPPRIVIYGVEKIGKSTLAANAESTIFLPTEGGLNQIECAKFPLCDSFDKVQKYLETLIIEGHDFRTVAVDSLDWLEKIIFSKVCQDSNVTSIELAAGGYGKGYTAALRYWGEILEMLDALREQKEMTVILIAHAQVERFEDPEHPAFDRYSPKLHKKTSGPLMTEWTDAILFATRKMRVQVEDNGFKKKRAIAAPIGASGGDRVLRCNAGPTCVAGNRYDMPDEIPLLWEEVAKYVYQ